MVTTVAAVWDVLCVSVVVEVATLAECCEVATVVVAGVAVEVGDGEDYFHRADAFVIIR